VSVLLPPSGRTPEYPARNGNTVPGFFFGARGGCKPSLKVMRRMYPSAQTTDFREDTIAHPEPQPQLVGPLEAVGMTAFGGIEVNGVWFRIFLENSAMQQLKHLPAFFLAVLLVSMLGCASTPTQEGTGEYIDDTVITTKVKAAIFNEPSLKVFQINVETFKGVVQLSGFVSSQENINKAVQVARGVRGVTSVRNDMRLR